MPKYPASIQNGLKNIQAAKPVIKSLYEENLRLKKSLETTQDELENWREKYHESDKQVSVLDERVSSSIATEIIKFLVSTILAGIGVNLATDGRMIIGGLFIAGSIISYIMIVKLGKK